VGSPFPTDASWLFGAFAGLGAAAGATFAVAHFAHGMKSLSIFTAVFVAFVGGGPGLAIGGLFYNMATTGRTVEGCRRLVG
jgi:hypothetical protein